MKTEKNILIAFLLNLSFAVFEVFGGIFTGSVAIVSDAVHDLGDALSIGISYFLEKKSKKQPDEQYTYGYTRYSLLGGLITTCILLTGSAVMIYNAVGKILSPNKLNYNGMLVLAIIGVVVNMGAALFTRKGDSLNQKAVNLHMLEDVLGWFVVLIGAIVMRFTDYTILDPILSLGVCVFIIIRGIKQLKEIIIIFLEKAPITIQIPIIQADLEKIQGVAEVHHIHIWSMDGQQNFATMHVVTDCDALVIKDAVRKKLQEYGIEHVTLELETGEETCSQKQCSVKTNPVSSHHHHHHHHAHHSCVHE